MINSFTQHCNKYTNRNSRLETNPLLYRVIKAKLENQVCGILKHTEFCL